MTAPSGARWPMGHLSSRTTIVAFNALAILPVFFVAAFSHPLIALAAAIISLALGSTFYAAVLHVPQRRLLQAISAWRAGAPIADVERRLPPEYSGLADTIRLAAERLEEREEALRRATEQQNLMMQEVHHRVKNNLQIVASLLNLQSNRIKEPAAQAEFQSARDRVRALATLHRHLYANGDLHSINLRTFLTELCGQLFSAFGEVPGNRITLRVDAPELEMSSDQAVPLALIVTEIVSNAVKFAFPGGRAGTVAIRLTTEGSDAELVVSDDGVGLEAEPDPGGAGRRDGIGLQLIRGFARQLGGTLNVEDGAGTTYSVRMKLHRERPVVSAKGVRPAT